MSAGIEAKINNVSKTRALGRIQSRSDGQGRIVRLTLMETKWKCNWVI